MAVVVRLEVHGARELIHDLRSGSHEIRQLMRAVVDKSAADLQAATQRNASGRPGPNVITGAYRASWRVDNLGDGAVVSRRVGSDAPQALRLEFGFVGPDRLGRVYDQPPFPHHRPAVDLIEPRFHEAMEQVAAKATNW